MNTVIQKRTFAALQYPKGSVQRQQFNDDALHSEYYTSHKWIVQKLFLMSDGTPHPTQKFISSTFKTRREAEEYANK